MNIFKFDKNLLFFLQYISLYNRLACLPLSQTLIRSLAILSPMPIDKLLPGNHYPSAACTFIDAPIILSVISLNFNSLIKGLSTSIKSNNLPTSWFRQKKELTVLVSPSLYHYTNITGLPFGASMMVMDMCCLHHCGAKIKGINENQK